MNIKQTAFCSNQTIDKSARKALSFVAWRNGNCKNKIIFDNIEQFRNSIDQNGKNVKYYIITSENALNNAGINNDLLYQDIYGYYIRIFCDMCCKHDTNLHRCKFNYKNKKETETRCESIDRYFFAATEVKSSLTNSYTYDLPVCVNHDPCFQCNKYTTYPLKSCKQCNKVFCKRKLCGFWRKHICGKCMAENEYIEIVELLQNILDEYKLQILADVHIITLLASYSRGFALLCCACDDYIITDTKHQFYSKQDREGETIYYYQPKYFNSAQKRTVLVKKKQYRAFCANCTEWKVSDCSFTSFGRKAVKERLYSYIASTVKCRKKEVDFVCGMHPYCDRCNQQERTPLVECKTCREALCNKHILNDYDKCGECMKRIEMRLIYRAIHRSISKSYQSCDFDGNICAIMANNIAQYGIGYIVNCYKCKKEISVCNEYEFVRRLDSNGRNIICYGAPNGEAIYNQTFWTRHELCDPK